MRFKVAPPVQRTARVERTAIILHELKPFLQIARFIGYAPYSLNANGFSLWKHYVIFCTSFVVFYTVSIYRRVATLYPWNMEVKELVLTLARTVMGVACINFDIVICIVREDKFQSYVAKIQQYDLLQGNLNAKSYYLRLISVCVLIVAFFCLLGFMTYRSEASDALESAMIYPVIYMPILVGVLKFFAMVAFLLARLRHLNRLLSADVTSIATEMDPARQQLRHRDVWRLHANLVAAAEDLNQLYSVQLFMWFGSISFNLISRIYAIISVDISENYSLVLREFALALTFVIMIAGMTWVCHVTASEANKVGLLLFSPNFRIYATAKADREDGVWIGQYFLQHRFDFSAGGGIFIVDLHLLQHIVGAITTYLVILKAPGYIASMRRDGNMKFSYIARLYKDGRFLPGKIKSKRNILDEIEPFFYTAVLFGCPPHRFSDAGRFVFTKWGRIYNYCWIVIFALLFCERISTIILEPELKLLVLVVARTILTFSVYFIDVYLVTLRHEQLQTALSRMRSYDLATKFECGPSVKTRFCDWTVVVCIHLFWVAVGCVSYASERRRPLVNSFTYLTLYMVVSSQQIKFVGLISLLERRFRHLNEILLIEDNRVIVPMQCRMKMQLQDVWWLHGCLMEAAEKINSVYSVQLLLWISNSSFNAVSRIYTISMSLPALSYAVARECLMVVSCIVSLLVIASVCHFTSAQANKVGSTVFSPNSVLSRKRSLNEDNVEVGVYFQLRHLHFSSAAGFIRVDLPLLLSIAAAMTTYLVILNASSTAVTGVQTESSAV